MAIDQAPIPIGRARLLLRDRMPGHVLLSQTAHRRDAALAGALRCRVAAVADDPAQHFAFAPRLVCRQAAGAMATDRASPAAAPSAVLQEISASAAVLARPVVRRNPTS